MRDSSKDSPEKKITIRQKGFFFPNPLLLRCEIRPLFLYFNVCIAVLLFSSTSTGELLWGPFSKRIRFFVQIPLIAWSSVVSVGSPSTGDQSSAQFFFLVVHTGIIPGDDFFVPFGFSTFLSSRDGSIYFCPAESWAIIRLKYMDVCGDAWIHSEWACPGEISILSIYKAYNSSGKGSARFRWNEKDIRT